tara:strand:+ start:712 stop:900 length:189 start_codon:yes stop_codon:yes gene_type:complete
MLQKIKVLLRIVGEMAVGVNMVSLEKTKEINTESKDNDDVDKDRGCKNMHLGDALGLLNRDA